MTAPGKTLARQDVLDAIRGNRGPMDLDLSGKDMRRIDLSARDGEHGLYLRRINLRGARLQLADLRRADLRGADLRCADLRYANLEGVNLGGARLGRARLGGVRISRDTELRDALWGSHILWDEESRPRLKGWRGPWHSLAGPWRGLAGHRPTRSGRAARRAGRFAKAANLYRQLENWYTDAGYYWIADEFHYREFEAMRKSAGAQVCQWWCCSGGWRERACGCAKAWWNWASLWLYRLLANHGDRPMVVILWVSAVVLGMALIYWLLGALAHGSFLSAAHYSAVSSIALGYGPWFENGEVSGWALALGTAQAFVCIPLLAFFGVTFARRMLR